MGVVIGGFMTLYLTFLRPDYPFNQEWAYREAHLEIVRREKAGLPLISKDLIDPKRVEKVVLLKLFLKFFSNCRPKKN